MNREHTTVWEACLRNIRKNVNTQTYKTWFEPIKSVALDADRLVIQVPNRYFYDWIEMNFLPLLKTSIRQELGETGKLEYHILVNNIPNPGTVVPTLKPPVVKTDPTDILDLSKINNPWVLPGIKKPQIDPQLNGQYTFDTFIEGDCNRVTRAAAIAVAKKPADTSFNPLFLYGKTGLGKTHLVQAIGNEIVKTLPDRRVMYVSSEKFGNQIVHAIKNNAVNDLLLFYQFIDVLIVDDIQLLAKREKTQEIFFHIFNHLHQNRKQLIFTSDKLPRDLDGIEERLLSRFRWGLSTDLQMPDFETRIAILDTKIEKEGLKAPKEVVEMLAHHLSDHIRDLEGVTMSLKAHVTLNNRVLDITLAREILKNYVVSSSEISIGLISKVVADYFNLTVEALCSNSRKHNVVMARHIAMSLCKKMTSESLKAIGAAFGGRDHSTVIYSCRTVKDLLDTDPLMRDTVEIIEKNIKMAL